MNGFIDIHTHLLPGVDDGAADMTEALRLVRIAYQNGTRAIVLTPHYRGRFKKSSVERLQAGFSEFSNMVKHEIPQMELYLGHEAYCERELPRLLAEKAVLTIHNSRYCLLEFSPGVLRSQLTTGVSEVVGQGFTPIIAHAERYNVLRKQDDLLDELLNMGALIQVNADSIMGKRGLLIRMFCNRLLGRRQVHFVASDAHDDKMRPPILRKSFMYIHKKYGAEFAHQLFFENAHAVLNGKILWV